MIESYDAFISYRHVPRDMKVAEEIQKELEHFKIPKEISVRTGIKKSERIFRDKSELPLSANLTDDIQKALENSKYLIVICSKEALASLWIKREIELFLENHSFDRVLTVLSEGEPDEVIPETLKYRVVEKINSHGKTVIETEPVEPLSCDYRMPFSKARKVELPRLAAVLLGCSYDELVQRANQYRLKRLRMASAGVFAVSAAAVSYLVWSNARIRENYEESQRNMSLYLADESLDALTNQDRIKALQYALDALPDEENQRPVIAEAEYALTQATGVYDLPGGSDFSAVRRYEAEYSIKDFLISPSEETMVAVDSEENVYIWNLENNELIYKRQFKNKDSINDVTILGEDEIGFYVSTDSDISLLDWESGQVIWNVEVPGIPESLVFNSDHSLLSKRKYKVTESYESTAEFYIISRNGKILSQMDTPILDKYDVDHIEIDSSGKKAVLIYTRLDTAKAIIMDIESSEYTVLDDNLVGVDYVNYDENGDIVLCQIKSPLDQRTAEWDYKNYVIFNMSEEICKYDSLSLEKIWSTSIDFSEYYRSFETMDYVDADGITHKVLICNTGSDQTIVNLEDGSILMKAEWPSAVTDVIFKTDTRVYSLLRGGDYAFISITDNYSGGIKAFVDNSIKAISLRSDKRKSSNILVLPDNEPYIILYDREMFPPEYRRMDAPSFSLVDKTASAGDVLVAEYTDENYDRHISVYNRKIDELIADYPVGDLYNLLWKLSEDGNTLYMIYKDYLSLTVKEISLPDCTESTYNIISDDADTLSLYYEIKGNAVYYGYSSGDNLSFGNSFVTGVYDLAARKSIRDENVYIKDWKSSWENTRMVFSEDGENFLLEIYDLEADDEVYKLYLVNSEKQMFLLDESDERHYYGSFNQSCTKAAVAFNGVIKVLDLNANVLSEIPIKNDSFLSLRYLDDELFVLTNEEHVYRYSDQNQLLNEYDVGIGANLSYFYQDVYSWDKIGNSLYLQSEYALNIIDLDQAQARACIENIAAYNADQKIVILEDRSEIDDYSFAILPLYSVDELVEIGRDMISE